jgi:PIN domain nuclease of toxin-antitoxin system
MRYLIDTHIFLWFVSGSGSLSSKAQNIISSEQNEIYLSIASLWEISIKSSLGKLDIIGDYAQVIDDVVNNNIQILRIDFSHTLIQNRLPFHHRDPFDRLLVSQAIVENMGFISCDEIFDSYLKNETIQRIW